jgi:hypothetical protein
MANPSMPGSSSPSASGFGEERGLTDLRSTDGLPRAERIQSVAGVTRFDPAPRDD